MIPKPNSPKTIEEYRPICLIVSLYKILSKLLASRIKKAVNTLVSSSQSTFISQSYIQDVVLVVNEVLDYAKRSKKECLVIKVEFRKVCDCISWDDLIFIMKKIKFWA